MSIPPAFERDPTLASLETRVLHCGVDRGRPFVLLEDTVFYPEGGGQPCDLGTVNGVAVLEVQKREGEIRHYLAGAIPEGGASLQLDWIRRFDHMQQHTGQHLLTALAQDRFHWATTAFHLGTTVCDIELDTPAISAAGLDRLEEAVAEAIRARREVSARWVSPEAYGQEEVRSRGLPEGHEGGIRLVEIAGVDLNTCGGTHLRHTGEIETLKLLGTESIRGGTRLFFVAGRRARQRLGDHERRTASFRTLLGAPDEDLLPALQIRLDQLLALDRRCRKLEEELAGALSAALAARPDAFVEAHLEGRDAAFLQRLARMITGIDPAKVVFLTTEQAGQGLFFLGGGEVAALDVAAAGREVVSLLGAKGGGAGKTFQGKAPDLAARAQAVAHLKNLVAPCN